MEDLRGMMTQFINGRLIIPTSFEECLTYAQQILFLAMHKQNKLVAGDNITITRNEDDTYTISSTGGASLDIDVQATIDANVGTPSVTIDTTDLPDGRTRYTFNFHNMKGEQGQQGPDGFSPEVQVSEIAGGHEVQITDSHGVSTFAVMDGEQGPAGADGQNGQNGADGTDGVSPTVSTSAIPNGTRVSITDAQGSHSFDVMNGQNGTNGTNGTDGTDGTDGVSPVITSAPITGGTRVTIVDAQGTTTFDVMNGTDGQTGQTGQTGPAGQDGTDGSLTWVTTVASTTPDYTWDVSDLVGVSGKTPKINDIIIQNISGETYMYVIDALNLPYVSASRIASLRGAQGVQGPAGADGQNGTNGTNGTNGVSPVVVVTQITGGHQIQITDAQGTSTFNVLDGTDGQDGSSVTFNIQAITGGHRVILTDAQGSSSFDVMDGVDGADSVMTWTIINSYPNNGRMYKDSAGYFTYVDALVGPSGATPNVGDAIIALTATADVPNYLTYLFRVTAINTNTQRVSVSRETPITCIPAGGTAGQVLSKVDSDDFKTQWVTPSGGGGGTIANYPIGVNLGSVSLTASSTRVDTNFPASPVTANATFADILSLIQDACDNGYAIKLCLTVGSVVQYIDITDFVYLNRPSDNATSIPLVGMLQYPLMTGHYTQVMAFGQNVPVMGGGFLNISTIAIENGQWTGSIETAIGGAYYLPDDFYGSPTLDIGLVVVGPTPTP